MGVMKKTKKSVPGAVPPKETDISEGLTSADVEIRREAGLYNREIDPHTKSVGQIFLSNICTYYNLVFTVIAVLVLNIHNAQDR